MYNRIAKFIGLKVGEIIIGAAALYGLFRLTILFGLIINPYFSSELYSTCCLFVGGLLVWCALGLAFWICLAVYLGVTAWIKFNWEIAGND